VSWEPGLDVHEWESEWASLEDDIADWPETALPVVHELIIALVEDRGVDVDRQDVFDQLDEYRAVFEALIEGSAHRLSNTVLRG
jgi:hypothetical protein